MIPYPSHLDSAAAYFNALAWHVRQRGVLALQYSFTNGEIRLACHDSLHRYLFMAPTPQECLRQLHEWVAQQQEAQQGEGTHE